MNLSAIPNWSTPREARELARLAAGKTVLEIGAYLGHSTILMAEAGATVWSVDWHRGDSGGDPGLGAQNTLPRWWANVRQHGMEDQVVGLVGRSHHVLPLLRHGSFGLIFIDGSHTLEAVRQDIALSLPLLRSGGELAFHDCSPIWPGVVGAIEELEKGAYKPYQPIARGQVDSLRVLHL